MEANYDEPEDGSDWVGKFEPDEVSKNIFESRIKDISFDDVLNCGTIFKRYSVRLKGDIGKSETSLSTDWYSIIDDNDGEYLLIIASVPQLLDVQIKTEELAEENIAKKEINSIDQILRLLGFNEGFDVYDVRYKHSFNDNNGSTFVCFKADMDLTEFVKKHKNYSEDYLEWCDELQAETDGILYNNLQNKLPENERIPFEYVVKCGTLFSSYTIKVTENQEVVTTNNTEWYLIDDGQKQYLWVGNIIPEMINIDFDEAKNIDNN